MKKNLLLLLTLLFTVGIGQMWGETATYSVTSTSTVSTSGAPQGSSATYSSTYSTKCQLTSGNSMTLTLSGYDGCTITGLTLSMKSNSSKGQGSMSMKVGTSTIASISNSKFNTSNWAGKWSTSYLDITPTVTSTTVGTSEKIVITISATENSLYCESFEITYTVAASCDKEVEVIEGRPSNGSFNISNNGTYKTCDEALVITLSNITPSAGYQFSEITQTGISSGVTIDNANKKVTYAQNTSGTSTINVTFTALETHSVTWMVNGSEYTTGSPTTQVYEGGKVTTLPTAPDPANYCGQVFAGWTTSPIDGETDTTPPVLFTTAASSPEITKDVTFYAVFADYEE